MSELAADVESESKTAGRGVNGFSAEEIRRMQAQLAGMADSGPSEPSEPPKLEAPKPEDENPSKPKFEPTPEPEPDPFPSPDGMLPLNERHFLWTLEAIEAGKYVHRGVTKYRPWNGILVGKIENLYQFMVFSPIVVSDGSGNLVEVSNGARVMVHANHSMRRLAPLFDFNGCPIVFVRMLRYHTLVGGTKDPMFEILIEPDPQSDPKKPVPRFVSYESATTRAEQAAARGKR